MFLMLKFFTYNFKYKYVFNILNTLFSKSFKVAVLLINKGAVGSKFSSYSPKFLFKFDIA